MMSIFCSWRIQSNIMGAQAGTGYEGRGLTSAVANTTRRRDAGGHGLRRSYQAEASGTNRMVARSTEVGVVRPRWSNETKVPQEIAFSRLEVRWNGQKTKALHCATRGASNAWVTYPLRVSSTQIQKFSTVEYRLMSTVREFPYLLPQGLLIYYCCGLMCKSDWCLAAPFFEWMYIVTRLG
jgi:hypothetical protein